MVESSLKGQIEGWLLCCRTREEEQIEAPVSRTEEAEGSNNNNVDPNSRLDLGQRKLQRVHQAQGPCS